MLMPWSLLHLLVYYYERLLGNEVQALSHLHTTKSILHYTIHEYRMVTYARLALTFSFSLPY